MSKEALLSNRMSGRTEIVEVEGMKIRVRGLSRYEMVQAGKIDDPIRQERYILSLAVVDVDGDGGLTEEEVGAWQEGSPPNEINDVATKINELSGIGKGAGKSEVS